MPDCRPSGCFPRDRSRAGLRHPSWVAAQLGHATPEMLFTVYARFIPNRTRRDGSALLARMTAPAASALGTQYIGQPR